MSIMLERLFKVVMRLLPYLLILGGSFILSLITVPLVREMNRALGMIDQPSARRINKTPVPRGGGIAVVFTCLFVQSLYVLITGCSPMPNVSTATYWRLTLLAVILAGIGFYDDKWGLKPIVKLFGQIFVASMTFFLCKIGFHQIFRDLPVWIDFPLMVFWTVGAINAFNLIDGLDGLAAGIALIAAIGMTGALCFIGTPSLCLVYLSFIGSVAGFLRYNFNPASVFLGDTGSMFLGFFLAVIPLVMRTGDSLLVGIGVPLLAMGVPIFDTALAILRRTIRALLSKCERGSDATSGQVMTADVDHLHHRLLRKFVSQKKVSFALYAVSAVLVLIGLFGVLLRDRAAGLYIIAFVIGVWVVVYDMVRIELWDTGRLLDDIVHSHSHAQGFRRYPLAVTYYVISDIVILVLGFFFVNMVLGLKTDTVCFHTYMPLRVVPIFLSLVFFRAYSTVWGRAQISNYIRLLLALICGTAITASMITLLRLPHSMLLIFSLLYSAIVFLAICGVRLIRMIIREFFYTVSSMKMSDDPEIIRTLVVGTGLRYAAFRRELVRSAATGKRFICGLVDDDPSIRGRYIGGVRIDGPVEDARRIVRRTNADEVVIAADLSPERRAKIVAAYAECGLTVRLFSLNETVIQE